LILVWNFSIFFDANGRKKILIFNSPPGYSSTPENESGKHVLTPSMVDRTSLQTIIYDAILIALTRRGFLYLALSITPCALTFPSLETSCKPLRRREEISPIWDPIQSKTLCIDNFSIFSDIHNTSYNLRVNQYCSRHIFLPEHLFKILTKTCQRECTFTMAISTLWYTKHRIRTRKSKNVM
jgi:hypothetical protein